jgi:hypothetical protein
MYGTRRAASRSGNRSPSLAWTIATFQRSRGTRTKWQASIWATRRHSLIVSIATAVFVFHHDHELAGPGRPRHHRMCQLKQVGDIRKVLARDDPERGSRVRLRHVRLPCAFGPARPSAQFARR